MGVVLVNDEKLFVSRIYDLVDSVEQYDSPKFSAFLNEREQFIVQSLLPSLPCEGRLFGGFSEAQRKMLALFPEHLTNVEIDFPFGVVRLSHLPSDKLSHRDVLGSLIGLGLSRESIGDILPKEGCCDFLVTTPVKPVVLENLKRIGSIGVRTQEGVLHNLHSVQEYVEKRGTIPSLRIDCLVSMLTNLSREKGAALLTSELVQRNYSVENRASASFSQDDVITIRGYGKYVVDEIGSPTRKQRFPILCRKYK